MLNLFLLLVTIDNKYSNCSHYRMKQSSVLARTVKRHLSQFARIYRLNLLAQRLSDANMFCHGN